MTAAIAPQGRSGLEIEIRFIFLQWMLHFKKPVVEINGSPTEVPWGRQYAPMAPGNYRVTVYFPWIFGRGCPATMDVTVYPGHITGMTYDTAFFTFMNGSLRTIGTRPHP